MGTEEARRIRQIKLDMGDEAAKLKIQGMKPAGTAGAVRTVAATPGTQPFVPKAGGLTPSKPAATFTTITPLKPAAAANGGALPGLVPGGMGGMGAKQAGKPGCRWCEKGDAGLTDRYQK